METDSRNMVFVATYRHRLFADLSHSNPRSSNACVLPAILITLDVHKAYFPHIVDVYTFIKNNGFIQMFLKFRIDNDIISYMQMYTNM